MLSNITGFDLCLSTISQFQLRTPIVLVSENEEDHYNIHTTYIL